MNSLPKTVTRQRRGCDLNPELSAVESSTLTTLNSDNMQLRPTSLIGPRGGVALAPFITDAVTTAYGTDKSDLVFRTASQGTSINHCAFNFMNEFVTRF